MRDLVNFSAGPSMLPVEVLESLWGDMRDYAGEGFSLVEMSHRGDVYGEVHGSCLSLLRELMGLPDSHEVILLGGGASLQFSMVPMNLPGDAAYVNSGIWAGKAIAEARKAGRVRVVYDGSREGFVGLPTLGELELGGDEAYLHVTTNETIGGLQWPDGFWKGMGTAVPLVADASSDVLGRPMDFARFGLVYAGAQKNLGPAGVTVVVIRRDLLEFCPDDVGSYLSYRVHASHRSLYNTPPVFSVWAMKLVLECLKRRGLEEVWESNEAQARMIYGEIEDSDGFYFCRVREGFRSRMNVVWNLRGQAGGAAGAADSDLEAMFLSEALDAGLVGLKGHRSVGGIRASIYNAMTDSGVDRLVSFMRDFQRRRG